MSADVILATVLWSSGIAVLSGLVAVAATRAADWLTARRDIQ